MDVHAAPLAAAPLTSLQHLSLQPKSGTSCGTSSNPLQTFDPNILHLPGVTPTFFFFPLQDGYLLLCTTQNGHLVVWKVLQDPSEDSSHQQAPETSSCSLQQQQPGRTPPDNNPSLWRVWNSKLHLGSVEGLAWQHMMNGGSVATVGGDCTVNLFQFCL